MHAAAAVLAFVTLVLYGYRSGQLALSIPEVVARVGIGLVLASLVVGFADLAIHHGAFEWRHWLVFGALASATAGYLSLLLSQRP